MITELTDMLDQLDQCRRRSGRLVGDNVYLSSSPIAKAAFVYTPAIRFEIKPDAPKIGLVPQKPFSEGCSNGRITRKPQIEPETPCPKRRIVTVRCPNRARWTRRSALPICHHNHLIVTLTMNPAIDRTIAVDRLAFDDRAYILSSNDSPGGRGINAASVIHAFGGKTLAIFPAGGDRGARFEHYMLDCGFPVATVPIRNDIRLNFTIVDRHGLTVKLNELGPRLERGELSSIEGTVEAQLANASWLMLCGSLPPGVPADFYAQLIARAKKKGVNTLLDADGEALSRGVEAGPTVVTPNQQEAERLLNTVLLTRSHSIAAVRRIQSMGAESVVLSLGSRGAIGAVRWQGADQLWEATPPRVEAISPIGAGDALAAALTWSLHNGDDFPEALSWGVAAGSASAQLPGTRFATLDQTGQIHSDVDLRRVDA